MLSQSGLPANSGEERAAEAGFLPLFRNEFCPIFGDPPFPVSVISSGAHETLSSGELPLKEVKRRASQYLVDMGVESCSYILKDEKEIRAYLLSSLFGDSLLPGNYSSAKEMADKIKEAVIRVGAAKEEEEVKEALIGVKREVQGELNK